MLSCKIRYLLCCQFISNTKAILFEFYKTLEVLTSLCELQTTKVIGLCFIAKFDFHYLPICINY